MKKKEILIHIHQCILKGGVEKVFYNILNNIPVENYHITVLSVMGYLKGDFDESIYPASIKRKCLFWDEFSSNFFRRIGQKIHNRIYPVLIKTYYKFKKFDVAIAAQEGFYADFVINNVKAHKKLLWIHNDMKQCHWSLDYFKSSEKERSCYEKFDKIVCVSKQVQESMRMVFGEMSNLTVCYNPIDTKEIDLKLRKVLNKRPFAPWFVCIGRLAHQKAYDRLFKVCSRLNQEGYKYNISILGEGEERSNLEYLLEKMKLSNIKLLGNKENPFKYLKSADWYLLPSRHEGFSTSLQEAAYCGTPIITTDVSGAKELLGENEYGIICENSEDGLYSGMKRILDSSIDQSFFRSQIAKRKNFVNLKSRIDAILNQID